jgi:hypothetical protein
MRHVVKALLVLVAITLLATPAARATGPLVAPNGSTLAGK